MKTLIQRYKSAMLQEKYTAFEGAYEVVHVNSSQVCDFYFWHIMLIDPVYRLHVRMITHT